MKKKIIAQYNKQRTKKRSHENQIKIYISVYLKENYDKRKVNVSSNGTLIITGEQDLQETRGKMNLAFVYIQMIMTREKGLPVLRMYALKVKGG